MGKRTGFFEHNGASLFYEEYLPASQAPGMPVAILHGGGEHSGRHEGTALYLATHGCYVLRHDMRGAGRSSGLQGHVDSFDEFISDLHALLKSKVNRPVFLLGQSVGGLLAAAFTLSHPEMVKGLVATSPFLRNKMRVPVWKEAAASALALLMPRLRLDSGLPLDKLSHDPNVEESYRSDKLCFGKVSTRWYAEVKKAQAKVLANAAQITVPALVVQGGGDCIADPAATKQFVTALGSKQKSLLFYPDAYHEVLNEKYREEALDAIKAFLIKVANKND